MNSKFSIQLVLVVGIVMLTSMDSCVAQGNPIVKTSAHAFKLDIGQLHINTASLNPAVAKLVDEADSELDKEKQQAKYMQAFDFADKEHLDDDAIGCLYHAGCVNMSQRAVYEDATKGKFTEKNFDSAIKYAQDKGYPAGDVAALTYQIVDRYDYCQDYNHALLYLKPLLERTSTANGISPSMIWAKYGWCLSETKSPRGIEVLKKAIAMARREHASLESIRRITDTLGTACSRADDRAEAIQAYESFLEVVKNTPGQTTIDVSKAQLAVADALRMSGRTSDADAQYEKILNELSALPKASTFEKELPCVDTLLLKEQNNTFISPKSGDPENLPDKLYSSFVLAAYQRVKSYSNQATSDEASSTLERIAENLEKCHHYAEAEDIYRWRLHSDLENFAKKKGSSQPLSDYDKLARCLQIQNKTQEALTTFEEALAFQKKYNLEDANEQLSSGLQNLKISPEYFALKLHIPVGMLGALLCLAALLVLLALILPIIAVARKAGS